MNKMSITSSHEPLLFCFCGPSGSGKSTICSQLANTISSLCLSISTTSRAPRKNEMDGIHYHFVSREEFQKRVREGEFLEHAEYSGNMYGTEKAAVRRALEEGNDVLLDIDVQGVQHLKDIYGSRCIAIFVHPPSRQELIKRMAGRGTETQAAMDLRLKTADSEIAKLRDAGFSQYLLINDRLEISLQHAQAIVVAERLRMSNQTEKHLVDVLGV